MTPRIPTKLLHRSDYHNTQISISLLKPAKALQTHRTIIFRINLSRTSVMLHARLRKGPSQAAGSGGLVSIKHLRVIMVPKYTPSHQKGETPAPPAGPIWLSPGTNVPIVHNNRLRQSLYPRYTIYSTAYLGYTTIAIRSPGQVLFSSVVLF
ncbi:hypothetical protein CC78DRAFT_97648 [Lojkania enalia]|uniref:Uncharacterized protein n=1 Tax=Lojkania enalia TaxID=147567 RepID=A0A9P4JY67_9PLEO|nr:hypothetical protein CC78DRAFT_97648 [Didymosphaeria enalia]